MSADNINIITAYGYNITTVIKFHTYKFIYKKNKLNKSHSFQPAWWFLSAEV